MNGTQLFLPFIQDVAFRDAASRVLENVLIEFEDLSGKKLEELADSNIRFLLDHIRNVIGIETEHEIDGFSYSIGRQKFSQNILEEVCQTLEDKWTVSVDESIIDQKSFVGGVAYRHSCAFGYKIPKFQKEPKERILAISSILRLQDEEDFDRKMMFLSYLYSFTS